ncbi:MAG: hypothetical protein R3F59_03415 [Myxococcota bacterium]
MATTRDQLQATLAVHDAAALRLILTASEVDPRDARTPAELAARIADAIWWNYCTPSATSPRSARSKRSSATWRASSASPTGSTPMCPSGSRSGR